MDYVEKWIGVSTAAVVTAAAVIGVCALAANGIRANQELAESFAQECAKAGGKGMWDGRQMQCIKPVGHQ